MSASVEAVEREARRPARGAMLGKALTLFGPFLGLILIMLLFSALTWKSGLFLTAYTWRTIAAQTVILGTAALGMTMIMIAGGIDLSVGSAVALVTVVVAMLVRGFALPDWLGGGVRHVPIGGALAIGVVLGAICGLLNGTLVNGLKVVPFIITLGSMKVFRGLAKWLALRTGGSRVPIPSGRKSWWMGQVLAARPEPWWLVVAPGVWVLLALGLVLALMLRYSLLGRYIYAVGSNESTARLCGIDVPKVKLTVYALAGLTFGLAGGFQLLKSSGGDPSTADGLELQVIAAVVIGGGSLSGGEGTMLGTLIGCLIISVLNVGCFHAEIPNAVQDIIIGAIIVAAVALDRLRRRTAD